MASDKPRWTEPRVGGEVGSVSFSDRCRQCRCLLHRTVPWHRGRTLATKVACGRCDSAATAPGVVVRRGRRRGTRAWVRKPTVNTEWARACASWRASADGQQGRCNGRAISATLLDHAPVPEPAMRAASDVEGRHAAHECLRVLARLPVRCRHRQQLAGCGQPLGLGRRCQQPIVTNALEARRQYVLQQPTDELLARHGDGALAARVARSAARTLSCDAGDDHGVAP